MKRRRRRRSPEALAKGDEWTVGWTGARVFIYYSRVFIIGGFAKREKRTDGTDVSAPE